MTNIIPIAPRILQRDVDAVIEAIQRLRRGGSLTEAQLVDRAHELNIELEAKISAARAAGAMK